VSADVDGCFVVGLAPARDEILAGELGARVARWRDDVRVYVFARSPSSGADSDAGASVGIPAAGQRLGPDLAVEPIVEGGGVSDAAEITSLRGRSPRNFGA
jgi:hypothetical protein